jgi:hypothetical protein
MIGAAAAGALAAVAAAGVIAGLAMAASTSPVSARTPDPVPARVVMHAPDPESLFEGFDADALDATERLVVFDADGLLAPAQAAQLGAIAGALEGSLAAVDAELCAAADDARGARALAGLRRAALQAGLPLGTVSQPPRGCRLPGAVVLRAGG